MRCRKELCRFSEKQLHLVFSGYLQKLNPFNMRMSLSNPLRRATALFLLGITTFYLIGCNYYKVNVLYQKDVEQVEQVQSQKKLLLHSGDMLYRIHNFKLNPGRDTIEMAISVATEKKEIVPQTYSDRYGETYTKDDTIIRPPAYYTGSVSRTRFNPQKQPTLLREVHFFLRNSGLDLYPGTVQIPLAALHEIHVIEMDNASSTTNTILAVAGGVVGALGLITIIALLFKSSCPYVYAMQENGYAFQGEVYSGAVMQSAERHDYLPLPGIQPYKGALGIRIANELQERQFVNLAELHAIVHPTGTRVLLDPEGKPRGISNTLAPATATSALGEDRYSLVATRDLKAYTFDEPGATQNQLQLQFNRPQGAKQAKLVLRAKNTLWFDQLYARFAEKTGTAYPALMARMGEMTREARMKQQQEQDFPLSVFLQTDNGQWVRTGQFPLTGPMGWRDMVIPLDISGVQGNTLNLRLETGFLFWEVDFAGMDFTDDPALEIVSLQAKSARDQMGDSKAAMIRSDDTLYLQQPRPGAFTDLKFDPVKTEKGRQVSYFLHVKGYYEHIRNFTNAPDMAEVGKFRQPHYFDKFSREEYDRLTSTTWKASDL
jgi:hypothetical protein